MLLQAWWCQRALGKWPVFLQAATWHHQLPANQQAWKPATDLIVDADAQATDGSTTLLVIVQCVHKVILILPYRWSQKHHAGWKQGWLSISLQLNRNRASQVADCEW